MRVTMKRRPEGGHKLLGEAGWGSTGAAGRKPSAHPPPATIACPARSPSASATGSVPPVPMFHPGAGRLGARRGAGRRPRGALRPPPTPAPAHPAPARALGAGKDGVRSSGGPSEGQPPCRRMAPHERSSLLLVSHSGLSLSCEIDILCHWTQSHSMDAVRTSFYRHSCGHRI